MASTINADNGVVSGSAGLKYGSDGTGVLALQTNGTTAVTINASQNVGIGATSIIAPLQIGVNANSSPAGNTGLTFRQASGSPTAGYGYSVRWDNANNTANDVGSIAYGFGVSAASAGYMRFSTADTERMRIDGSGNVTMTGTLTTSSRGIAKASMPTGSVLQVVTGSTSTQVTNSTSTYTDTGLTATITPLFSSSKILILTNIQGLFKSSDNNSNRLALRLFRGATALDTADGVLFTSGTSIYLRTTFGHSYYDTPSTTSATTYKWQFNNTENVASVAVQKDSNSGTSQIILMEIAV